MNRSYAVLPDTCPPWCAVRHGIHVGEEDRVHVSRPLPLSDGIVAQLCVSLDQEGNTQDGPYVLVGSDEYTLDEAKALGAALIAMADLGRQATRHAEA